MRQSAEWNFWKSYHKVRRLGYHRRQSASRSSKIKKLARTSSPIFQKAKCSSRCSSVSRLSTLKNTLEHSRLKRALIWKLQKRFFLKLKFLSYFAQRKKRETKYFEATIFMNFQMNTFLYSNILNVLILKADFLQ